MTTKYQYHNVHVFYINYFNVIFKVDGGYGAMSAEGHGEQSSFAGCSK